MSWVETVLGRAQRPARLDEPLARLIDERVLVTGAAGSIGEAIVPILKAAGITTFATDIDTDTGANWLDVCDFHAVNATIETWRPTIILHLAGAKHAPEGELNPWETTRTNSVGTDQIVKKAVRSGARVVLASTGKACDPETVYGASKLIAERIALEAGQSVARFYNVVETQGNVFDIWRNVPSDQPLLVTPCERYFVSLAEAVSLVLWTAVLPAGRYTIDPGWARYMPDVVADLHPGRQVVLTDPRRGDRLKEPRRARSEAHERYPHHLERVVSVHETAILPVWESAA